MADVIVGYCVLDVDDSAVVGLDDGVDYAGSPVTIPSSATGAVINFKTLSTSGQCYFSTNGDDPNPATDEGDVVDDAKVVFAEIIIGKTSEAKGDPGEIRDFKARCASGGTCRIEVTYMRYED
ncbi:MAG: hypothetical protein JNM00_08345 [Flavobacteriales bacterium]|nr:hypothetical protein [Flavobacteriales bacterium]